MVLISRENKPTRKTVKDCCREQLTRNTRRVGHGTFGHISAFKIDGIPFAVKRFTYSETSLHMTTLREIKALMTIKSKYIVEVEKIIINDYKLYLVMPLYDVDLYKLLEHDNITLCDIKHIFWQILVGIKDIHNAGYLHRDIKSANILINNLNPNRRGMSNESPAEFDHKRHCGLDRDVDRNDGRPADFDHKRHCGLNRDVDRNDGRPAEFDHKRDERPAEFDHKRDCGLDRDVDRNDSRGENTHAKQMKIEDGGKNIEKFPGKNSCFSVRICDFGMARTRAGDMTPNLITLWYRPPEILLGTSNYTKATDIWSAGCILLEMFNKKAIFKSETEIETLNLIASLCGSINEESMPGCSKYPAFHSYNIKDGNNSINKIFSNFNGTAVDLASKMLSLDPRKRPTATECLQHPFFSDTN